MTWERISEHLREEGRDPHAFPRGAYHNINIGADRQTCLAESQRFLDAYYGPTFTPAMVESWTAAGTTGECVERLRALVKAGATHIMLRATSWDQRRQYERLVMEVLPAFRDVQVAGESHQQRNNRS